MDAKILADLLRIGMLPLCFVPSERTSYLRSLARHRKHFVDTRTHHKHLIHSILMMDGTRIDETAAFSKRYIKKLRDLRNYRIDAYLDMIEAATARIKGIDERIGDEISGPDGEDMREVGALISIKVRKISTRRPFAGYTISSLPGFCQDGGLCVIRAGRAPKLDGAGHTRPAIFLGPRRRAIGPQRRLPTVCVYL